MTGFRSGANLRDGFRRQRILQIEDLLQLFLHLILFIVLIEYRQKRRQLVGIVVDFRQAVPILVVVRVFGFNVVDPALQVLLQLLVILLYGEDLVIVCGVR